MTACARRGCRRGERAVISTQAAMPDSLTEPAAELRAAAEAKKCWACGVVCIHSAVRNHTEIGDINEQFSEHHRCHWPCTWRHIRLGGGSVRLGGGSDHAAKPTGVPVGDRRCGTSDGAALLAVKYLRAGNDVIASGFLVFAIGEGILLSGPAAGAVGSIPSFAAGTTLWGTSLLLVSIPRTFAMPIRILGIVSAVLFIVTAARIFWGEQLLPTSTPLPSYAYPLLVATFMGWIWTLWRERAR